MDEGQGAKTLEDVYFLSRIEAAYAYTVFSAYNGLGLAEKHPMSIIAQLLKALSVGSEGNTYRFAYDSFQRRYRYQMWEILNEFANSKNTAQLAKAAEYMIDKADLIAGLLK